MLSRSEWLEWVDTWPIPPTSCHGCTALIVCLADCRADHTGQRHLDGGSRLAADLPTLYSDWWLEDAREWHVYAARGEGEILRAARALYAHGWYWPWWVPGAPESEYVPELDGDPWEDAEGVDHRPDWCTRSL